MPSKAKVINDLTIETKRQMKQLAKSYNSGESNLPEFEIGMAKLIKSSHILAGGIAKGGKDGMTQSDWGRVGQRIGEQYKYLTGFERKIKNGKLSAGQIVARAALYAASARVAFYALEKLNIIDKAEVEPKARRVLNAMESCSDCIQWANDEFIPYSDLPEIGSGECGQYCLCEIEFEDDV